MTNELTTTIAVQTFYHVGDVINANSGRQEILERTLQTLIAQLDYKAASVRLLDPERQTLEIQATVGLSDQYLGKGPVEVANSLIDRDVLEGQVVALEDIESDDRWQYPEQARAEGIRSVLAIPLRIRGRYSGVLRAYTSDKHQFSDDERLLVSAVGNLIARLIRNKHFQQSMHKIATEINSSLELKKVLQVLLDSITVQINCKAASIRLLGPKKRRLHLVATQGLSDQYLQKGEIRVEESPINRQVIGGDVVTIYDVANEPGLQYPQEAAPRGHSFRISRAAGRT